MSLKKIFLVSVTFLALVSQAQEQAEPIHSNVLTYACRSQASCARQFNEVNAIAIQCRMKLEPQFNGRILVITMSGPLSAFRCISIAAR